MAAAITLKLCNPFGTGKLVLFETKYGNFVLQFHHITVLLTKRAFRDILQSHPLSCLHPNRSRRRRLGRHLHASQPPLGPLVPTNPTDQAPPSARSRAGDGRRCSATVCQSGHSGALRRHHPHPAGRLQQQQRRDRLMGVCERRRWPCTG